jgi:fucose permease
VSNQLSLPRAGGVLACLGLLLIGWTGLLVPALIRPIQEHFVQNDAGLGIFYLLYSVAYATGSLGGGLVTERVGRRAVLALACGLHGLGLASLGLVGSWELALATALPAGLGAGVVDGGMNSLVLDLYPSARGRALNTLHLFFSIGAFSSPLLAGRLFEGGVAWQSIVMVSALLAIPLGGLFAVVDLPHGRHEPDPTAEPPARLRRLAFSFPLLALEIAIACYVASEVGVSNWLVRFLEEAPIGLATTALSLYWGGLAVGRLISARISDRFDHLAFATIALGLVAVATAAAVFAPTLELKIALFVVVGMASGPVFPLIVAIGGERHPQRTAAVSGFLTGAAVIGSIVYPPVMGFLSVTVGLVIAMFGAAVLALVGAGALFAARGRRSA